jgi:hypothetical protein
MASSGGLTAALTNSYYNFQDPSMISRRITVLLALCMLASSAFAASSDPARTPAALQARLVKMDPGARTECHKDSYGNAACTSDGYTVDLSGCSGDMLFGQVMDDAGATLGTRLDAGQSKPVVKLKPHQFLCVIATAKKPGASQRYYVAAYPADRVPDCKGSDLCKAQPIEWVGTPPAAKCEWIGTSGDFNGGCAAGWVDEDAIELYSMGLK